VRIQNNSVEVAESEQMSCEVVDEGSVLVKLVKLQSCDGALFEVDADVVSMCATVKNMLRGKSAFRNSLGGQFSIDGSYVILKKEGRVLASLTKNSDDEAIVSLPDVKAATLQKVIEYCKFHNANTATDKEKKAWDVEFVQVKQSVLCELASASYYLDIKPLVNLTSRAIATQISGKTSEEIRETFCNINYEVYAPVFASSLATRCRLQRKYNRKKQTQDKDQKMLTSSKEDDNRSVDELLEFIGEDPKNGRAITPPLPLLTNTSIPIPTKKKANKKAKKKKKGPKADDDLEKKEENLKQDDVGLGKSTSNSSSSKDEEDEDDLYYLDKDDVLEEGLEEGVQFSEEEEGDDLDPEMRAALDKEVEDFRQRLESINSQTRTAPKIPLPVSAASFVSSLVGVH